MNRHTLKRILVAGIVGIFVVASVQPAAGQRLQVSKGKATIQIDDQSQTLNAGDGMAVKPGAKVTVPGGGGVTVQITKGASLTLEENSVVKLNKVQGPAGKKAGMVDVEVLKGGVATDVVPPRETATGKKQQPQVKFQIKVGDMTASGTSFTGRIARLDKKSFRAETTRGDMQITEGYLLVDLSGKQSITRLASSIVLKAGSNNDGPVTAAFSGAAIMQLQPGQSVRLEPMDGPTGVWMQNLSPNQPMQVANWEGLPTRTLDPQQRRLFVVVERDVPANIAWAHIEDVSGQIGAPAVAAPEEGPAAARRFVRPVIVPRHDRISASD